MVYWTSRSETRTLIKAAVLCALRLSATPFVNAETSLDGSTATDADICNISDGDKSVGIHVIDDSLCASGGLGCYNDHCRFCKILETPQSSAFESCATLGVDFPPMDPLVAPPGSCEVSNGDAAVGISAVTDGSCLYGGLGCFNDHCRFCKTSSSVQSTAYLDCTQFVSSDLTKEEPVVDDSDLSDDSDASTDYSGLTDDWNSADDDLTDESDLTDRPDDGSL